jgi:hypothetical protein
VRIVEELIDQGKIIEHAGTLSNRRAEKALIDRQNRAKKATHAASQKWSALREKTETNQGAIDANASHKQCLEVCLGDASQSQSQNQSKERVTKVTPKKVIEDPLFDRFWSIYPRKIGKGGAIKAWRAAVKKIDPAVIIEGLELHLPDLAEKQKQYIPHPATWLNEERWADELDENRDSFWDTFTWENPT